MGDLARNIVPVDDFTEATYRPNNTSAASDHPGVQYPEGGASSSRNRPNRGLSADTIMSILSNLSVPALLRCRSVCKTWNKLLRDNHFLDRWDQQGGKLECLFVTRYLSTIVDGHPDILKSCVDDAHWRKSSFFDLHERRWYSCPTSVSEPAPSNVHHVRLLAMDDGLICELAWLGGVRRPRGERRLDIFDPVAKRRRWLPLTAINNTVVWKNDDLPVIVTVVNNTNRSFRIFLMERTFAYGPTARLFVYESSTNEWQRKVTAQARLDNGVNVLRGGRIGESAVFFQGNLYVAVQTPGPRNDRDTVILSYNLQGNLWRVVLAVGVRYPAFPHLIVSGNRMFISIWSMPPAAVGQQCFEIREILLNPNSTTSVVIFTVQHLQQISGEPRQSIQYGFPLNYNSVLLLTLRTGRLLTCNHINGVPNGPGGELPPHPLPLSDQEVQELQRNAQRTPHYRGRLSKLSLRNIL